MSNIFTYCRDIFTCCRNLESELIGAAYDGNIHEVRYVLKLGVRKLNRALEWAALRGHFNIVQLLLEHGADNLNKALENATIAGNIDIVQILLHYGANNTMNVMIQAAKRGHDHIIELLIENRVKYSSSYSMYGRKVTPRNIIMVIDNGVMAAYNLTMEYAATLGYIEIVRMMLDQGATSFDSSIANATQNQHPYVVNLIKNRRDGSMTKRATVDVYSNI